MNTAPLLPGIITGEPVEVSGADLASTIREIEAQGYFVRRMDADGSTYRLHLCRCPICAERAKPASVSGKESLSRQLEARSLVTPSSRHDSAKLKNTRND